MVWGKEEEEGCDSAISPSIHQKAAMFEEISYEEYGF